MIAADLLKWGKVAKEAWFKKMMSEEYEMVKSLLKNAAPSSR